MQLKTKLIIILVLLLLVGIAIGVSLLNLTIRRKRQQKALRENIAQSLRFPHSIPILVLIVTTEATWRAALATAVDVINKAYAARRVTIVIHCLVRRVTEATSPSPPSQAQMALNVAVTSSPSILAGTKVTLPASTTAAAASTPGGSRRAPAENHHVTEETLLAQLHQRASLHEEKQRQHAHSQRMALQSMTPTYFDTKCIYGKPAASQVRWTATCTDDIVSLTHAYQIALQHGDPDAHAFLMTVSEGAELCPLWDVNCLTIHESTRDPGAIIVAPVAIPRVVSSSSTPPNANGGHNFAPNKASQKRETAKEDSFLRMRVVDPSEQRQRRRRHRRSGGTAAAAEANANNLQHDVDDLEQIEANSFRVAANNPTPYTTQERLTNIVHGTMSKLRGDSSISHVGLKRNLLGKVKADAEEKTSQERTGTESAENASSSTTIRIRGEGGGTGESSTVPSVVRKLVSHILPRIPNSGVFMDDDNDDYDDESGRDTTSAAPPRWRRPRQTKTYSQPTVNARVAIVMCLELYPSISRGIVSYSKPPQCVENAEIVFEASSSATSTLQTIDEQLALSVVSLGPS